MEKVDGVKEHGGAFKTRDLLTGGCILSLGLGNLNRPACLSCHEYMTMKNEEKSHRHAKRINIVEKMSKKKKTLQIYIHVYVHVCVGLHVLVTGKGTE